MWLVEIWRWRCPEKSQVYFVLLVLDQNALGIVANFLITDVQKMWGGGDGCSYPENDA